MTPGKQDTEVEEQAEPDCPITALAGSANLGEPVTIDNDRDEDDDDD